LPIDLPDEPDSEDDTNDWSLIVGWTLSVTEIVTGSDVLELPSWLAAKCSSDAVRLKVNDEVVSKSKEAVICDIFTLLPVLETLNIWSPLGLTGRDELTNVIVSLLASVT